MSESWVNLACPTCTKHWSDSPSSLPDHDATVHCPDCGTDASLAEFLRSSRDLEIVKSLAD